MNGILRLIALLFLVSILSTCMHQASESQASSAPAIDEQPAAAEKLDQAEPEEREPDPANNGEDSVTPDSSNSYEMDKEEYESTKKDLSELVDELNHIIAAQNYEQWLTYLTPEYKEYYSDPNVLAEFSETPLLQKYNIKLRSLKDYFNYVVVASRKDVRIDDISALSESKVKAYMIVKDEPIVVYTLEKVGEEWKITR